MQQTVLKKIKTSQEASKETAGRAGNRTQDLSHADTVFLEDVLEDQEAC